MKTPMMKCGHSANAEHEGNPCCAICAGIIKGWDEIDDTPDLSGRVARCSYCRCEQPSNTDLAFFAHTPELPYDRYYCGCRGWD